ncbi:uncharacterized protein V6R79_018010 [Siganus canaliculatus]
MMDSMDTAGSFLGLAGTVLAACRAIYQLVRRAKTNKGRCQQLSQKVQSLEKLVFQIQQRFPDNISPHELTALIKLHRTLDETQELIRRYSQTKGVAAIMKSNSIKDKFNHLDEKLSSNLQILSGALLVEQLDVMHDVYDTIREVRPAAARPSVLPQEPGPQAAAPGPQAAAPGPQAAAPGPQAAAPGPTQAAAGPPLSGPFPPGPYGYGYGYGYGYFPPRPTLVPWPGFGAMTPVSVSTTITTKVPGRSPIVLQSTAPPAGFSGFPYTTVSSQRIILK